MAKINIYLNNKNYSIEDSLLISATDSLKSHLSTVMNGTGDIINLGGVSYNIDSTKLATARTNFISALGSISGQGEKVVVSGVEFSIDSTKISGAFDALVDAFDSLESGDDNTRYDIEDNEAGGQTFRITDMKAVLSSVDNEFGGQTAVIN